jgi:hypothetical protein
MWFLSFSKNATGPAPNPSANYLAARNILFLLVFFSDCKVGNPTHGLRIGNTVRKTGEGV